MFTVVSVVFTMPCSSKFPRFWYHRGKHTRGFCRLSRNGWTNSCKARNGCWIWHNCSAVWKCWWRTVFEYMLPWKFPFHKWADDPCSTRLWGLWLVVSCFFLPVLPSFFAHPLEVFGDGFETARMLQKVCIYIYMYIHTQVLPCLTAQGTHTRGCNW